MSSLFELLALHLASRPAAEVPCKLSSIQAAPAHLPLPWIVVSQIIKNRTAVYAVIHLVLGFRSNEATGMPAVAFFRVAAAAEDACGKALMLLTSCLNEAQFLPLLSRALAFAAGEEEVADLKRCRVGVGRGGADATTTQTRCDVSPHRVLSFYRLLAPSQTRFAALYAPLFARCLPFATRVRAPAFGHFFPVMNVRVM